LSPRQVATIFGGLARPSTTVWTTWPPAKWFTSDTRNPCALQRNGRFDPKGDVQCRADERAGSARKRTLLMTGLPPSVQKHCERMMGRPSVRKALEDEALSQIS
jgi:hypothetical protein